jgi:hypothetical protein
VAVLVGGLVAIATKTGFESMDERLVAKQDHAGSISNCFQYI